VSVSQSLLLAVLLVRVSPPPPPLSDDMSYLLLMHVCAPHLKVLMFATFLVINLSPPPLPLRRHGEVVRIRTVPIIDFKT